MKVKPPPGTAMRKKTVIALARQLAIDLWRWRTGRCTMADPAGGGVSVLLRDELLNLKLNILISVLQRVATIGQEFAIGRVLSVAAAGQAQAYPSVRWDGLPGRRSHSSKTPWALGLIPTVRIGAGAWRKLANTRPSGDTDQARTDSHGADQRTRNRRKNREDAFKEETAEPSQGPALAPVMMGFQALPRDSAHPLRSARPTLPERKNLTDI